MAGSRERDCHSCHVASTAWRLAQHLCTLTPPPAGHLLHRGRVVGCGCLLWSACTALFAACHSLHAGIAVWAVNGLGLALVLPNSQARMDATVLT